MVTPALSSTRIAAIIPTFNNGATIRSVVIETLAHVSHVIVVDDGSTDDTGRVLSEVAKTHDGLMVVAFASNRGKGCALRQGFEKALEAGFTNAITLDADGQHYPSDIAAFLQRLAQSSDALYLGERVLEGSGAAMPLRSAAGAKFGAFWYKFFTGIAITDTQSGFRAYPLKRTLDLNCKGSRYEYEQEVLIKAAWSGMAIETVAVHRHYEPRESAVSHFRPVRDFLRISKVNSKAALTKIFFPFLIVHKPGSSWKEKILALFKYELRSNATPKRAAFSLTLGVFVGLLPIYFFQVVSLVVLSFIIRINRPLAFLGVSVSSAPFLPFIIAAAIAVGKLAVPSSWESAFSHGRHGALLSGGIDWFFGSIILACTCAAVCWIISYPFFLRMSKRKS